MKRTILFKANKLSDGKWVKGSLVKSPLGTQIVKWEDSIEYIDYVNPSTVCQFTGLKNKDGKPIWEHDIICNPFLDDKGQEVIFNNGVFMIDGIPISEEILFEENVVHLQNLGSKFDRKEGEK